MMTDRKWSCLTIAVLIALSPTCFAAQTEKAGQADVSAKPLTEDFLVPLTRQVRADQDAQRKVVEFIQAHLQEQKRVKEDAARRVAQVNPDSPDADKRSASELQEKEDAKNKQLRASLALCKQTEGTDAGLTSVLLLAALASHDRPKAQRPNLTPITNALATIRQDFPGTWQGQVAPLMQATLMKQAMAQSGQRKAVNLLSVVEWLKRNMPSQDEELDLKRPDIDAFRSVYPLQSPLKANYLKSLANTQFQIGTPDALDEATKTCAEVIRLYPDGEHAAWARRLLDQIAALRESMK